MSRAIPAVPLPSGSLVSQLPFTDYADAYRVELDPKAVPDVDTFARSFVKEPPAWIGTLMRARDAVVGLVGLKKSSDAPASSPAGPISTGDFIAFFRVVDRSNHEIIAGEDDRHLDFRVSFLYRRDDEGRAHGIVSTVVRFHNALGRAYFLPVAPVHRVIVPAMLARTAGAATSAR